MSAEANLQFADALVAQFVELGAGQFVLSPGSRSTPLTTAAARCPGARTWVNLDERGAAFFAQAIAKASGKPAILICTSGTAAANYLPAVIEAAQSGAPLLILTADRPASLHECGAPQTVNQLNLYGANARWFLQCPEPGTLSDPAAKARAVAARAWSHAMGSDPGPVHLNCPFDEPLIPQPLPAFEGSGCVEIVAGEPQASESAATRLADLLQNSRRGVIVAGPLPYSRALREGVLSLAAASGVPVLADATSQLRFGDARGACVLSHFDAWLRAAPPIETPDLIIRMGAQPTSKALQQWIAQCHTTQVVFENAGRWTDSLASASVILPGDPAATLTRAATHAEQNHELPWAHSLRDLDALAKDELGAFDELETGAEIALAQQLARTLPAGSNLFLSNSMPIREIDWFAPAREAPVNVFVNRGANGIDGIVSSALGVAAATGRRTCLLTGDLALLHDLNALAFAATNRIALDILVINNDGGGIFGYLPISGTEVFEYYFRTPHGRAISDAASALGVPCTIADDLTDIADWLARAAQGPRLLEIPIDAAHSKAVHQRYWERVATRVHEQVDRRVAG